MRNSTSLESINLLRLLMDEYIMVAIESQIQERTTQELVTELQQFLTPSSIASKLHMLLNKTCHQSCLLYMPWNFLGLKAWVNCSIEGITLYACKILLFKSYIKSLCFVSDSSNSSGLGACLSYQHNVAHTHTQEHAIPINNEMRLRPIPFQQVSTGLDVPQHSDVALFTCTLFSMKSC